MLLTIVLIVVSGASYIAQWALGYIWHDKRKKSYRRINMALFWLAVTALCLAVTQAFLANHLSISPSRLRANAANDWSIVEFRLSNPSDQVRYGVWLEGNSPEPAVEENAIQLSFDVRASSGTRFFDPTTLDYIFQVNALDKSNRPVLLIYISSIEPKETITFSMRSIATSVNRQMKPITFDWRVAASFSEPAPKTIGREPDASGNIEFLPMIEKSFETGYFFYIESYRVFGRDWLPPKVWEACETDDPASCTRIEIAAPKQAGAK
jgi:hypothetical protein